MGLFDLHTAVPYSNGLEPFSGVVPLRQPTPIGIKVAAQAAAERRTVGGKSLPGRHGGRPRRCARPGSRTVQIDRLHDLPGHRRRVPRLVPPRPVRHRAGLPFPRRQPFPDARRRAGAGRLGHHHRRQAGLRRPGRRSRGLHRRVERFPDRPDKARADLPAAGHLATAHPASSVLPSRSSPAPCAKGV